MLLRLGDTNQASQVGVAEVPGALNSAPVAQHQRKRGAWLGALPRNLHSGEATRLRIVPAAVIIQRASGDAILAAILRSRDRPSTVAFQQALDLFRSALRRHTVMSAPRKRPIKRGWLDAYNRTAEALGGSETCTSRL